MVNPVAPAFVTDTGDVAVVVNVTASPICTDALTFLWLTLVPAASYHPIKMLSAAGAAPGGLERISYVTSVPRAIPGSAALATNVVTSSGSVIA